MYGLPLSREYARVKHQDMRPHPLLKNKMEEEKKFMEDEFINIITSISLNEIDKLDIIDYTLSKPQVATAIKTAITIVEGYDMTSLVESSGEILRPKNPYSMLNPDLVTDAAVKIILTEAKQVQVMENK